MKNTLIALILLISSNVLTAQVEDAWVYFVDKPNKATYLSNPLSMLTQRALDRRIRYAIPIDDFDVPVEETYITAVENSSGITVKATSKWFNTVHVQGTKADIDALSLLQINGNQIVNSIQYANKNLSVSGKKSIVKAGPKPSNKLKLATNFNYGQASNQINMLKGEILHLNNFTGAGMQIAVIDAGFPNVNTFSAFQRIRDNNQILGGYDYVNRNSNFYTGYYHGMSVLSTIAGYIYSDDGNATNDFIGTAPDASFYLFITEDYNNETPLEESLWVEAAEEADRLGVDVINTSLGYYEFDTTAYNYTYADMNGNTTFISKGAEMAFSRGMLIVNSAGNEGNNAWHYIVAPADAPSVLSIGAVDKDKIIASFSSYGPTSDGRVKPDVCAEGAGVYIINSVGSIATSNGTSFSAPIMAGMAACLWQAFPEKNNAQLTQLIKESSHLYTTPTIQEGYGIPNFETIYNTLSIQDVVQENLVTLYPNPTSNNIYFKNIENVSNVSVALYSTLGVMVLEKNITFSKPMLDISTLKSGIYFAQINSENSSQLIKIIKK